MDIASATTIFSWLDRELWLVTAQADSRRGGLIATFVNQASIVPDLPRVVVGLSRQHHTGELVEHSRAFALHLLGERHLDWVWRFGLESGRDRDKLHGLRVRPGDTGSPILEDALAWLDCRVEDQLDTGDRTLYVAEIVQSGIASAEPLLTMKRLLQLATSHQLAELKRQLQNDGRLDAEAIRQWRSRRTEDPRTN